jgi:hypothetical protein
MVMTHATRWYLNLLLVERDADANVDGSWSLSPTGSGAAIGMRDGTERGHLNSFNDEAKARLCDLRAP